MSDPTSDSRTSSSHFARGGSAHQSSQRRILWSHDFRTTSPYARNNKTWLSNIILTVLLHLDGADQRSTLEAAAGYSAFAPAMLDVLGTDWRDRREWIDAHAVRDMSAYWKRFPKAAAIRR